MFNEYKSYLKSRNLSQLTVKNYLSDLNDLLGWFKGNFNEQFRSNSFDNPRLKAYSDYILNNSLSISSKKRRLSSIKVFIRWFNNFYNCKISLTPVYQTLDSIKEYPKFEKKPLVSKRIILLAIFALLVFPIAAAFYTSSSLSLGLDQKNQKNQSGLGRLIYYKDVDSFRSDIAMYNPSVFGFNHEAGEYYILFENEQNLVGLTY